MQTLILCMILLTTYNSSLMRSRLIPHLLRLYARFSDSLDLLILGLFNFCSTKKQETRLISSSSSLFWKHSFLPHKAPLSSPHFYRPAPSHPHSYAPDVLTTSICHVSSHSPHFVCPKDCTIDVANVRNSNKRLRVQSFQK